MNRMGNRVDHPDRGLRVHPKYKAKYRVRNWSEYDQALVQRGDITLWISEEAIRGWKPALSGKRGGQKKFSDHAIETALVLRHSKAEEAEALIACNISEQDDSSRQAGVLSDRCLMKIMRVERRDAAAFLFMHQRQGEPARRAASSIVRSSTRLNSAHGESAEN